MGRTAAPPLPWNMWVPEQFNLLNMNPGVMPQLPPPLLPLDSMIPMGTMGGPELNLNHGPNRPDNNFIGPIPPEDQDTTMDLTQDAETNKPGQGQGDSSNQSGGNYQGQRGRPGNQQDNHNNRESRWNRNRDRDSKDNSRHDRNDRGRRPRSQDRNRDRSDRSRSDRGNRDRVSRFESRDKPLLPGMPGTVGHGGQGRPGNNMMMPGMMHFGNNMMPGQQQMDMHNMPNTMMSHGNMMGNMMPGMMEQNMMIAQQQMQMVGLHPIFFQDGVLLPPIPGVAMPARRERPVGCRTIFVGGLPTGIGMDVIKDIFQRFGSIDDIKLHKQGACHIRFMQQEIVDQSFMLSGYRFKTHDQSDIEATTLFIDFALNRDDQTEIEKYKREPTPPRIEPFTPAALTMLTEKIKSDTDFAESAPTLAGWLEKGECNKKNANAFYSLIQACNNQVRRLYNEKMGVDEEFFNLKTSMKDKFAHIILQFEQVAKILSAAKHKRASDHFTKQQRRNIEMWLKMTEDLENIKEEFNMIFDDEETEKIGQKLVSAEKYEQIKAENDTLICELEGYRNEAHLAKDEAERKFEKFKAHFIAQQALHAGNRQQGGIFPPLPPPPPMPGMEMRTPPTPEDSQNQKQEAKLVSMLTAFLLAHPLGATLDYLSSYVRSMIPTVAQNTVNAVLMKYSDIFSRGPKDRWTYVLFDIVKREGH